MKKFIIFVFLLIFITIGYSLYGWKGSLFFIFIFFTSSLLSEVLFWKKMRKEGKKDLIDIIIDKLKKSP
jgi:hypothetical protein